MAQEPFSPDLPSPGDHGVKAAESSSSIPLMSPKDEVCVERGCISARTLEPPLDSSRCSEKGDLPAALRLGASQ